MLTKKQQESRERSKRYNWPKSITECVANCGRGMRTRSWHHSKGLCHSCYKAAKKAGTLEKYPKVGHTTKRELEANAGERLDVQAAQRHLLLYECISQIGKREAGERLGIPERYLDDVFTGRVEPDKDLERAAYTLLQALNDENLERLDSKVDEIVTSPSYEGSEMAAWANSDFLGNYRE